MWCYRRILRISWKGKKTNEWVIQQIGEVTLMDSINKRTLSFIGHVARIDELGKDIIAGMVDGRRRRGRRRRKLERDIHDLTGLSMAGLLREAQKRDC